MSLKDQLKDDKTKQWSFARISAAVVMVWVMGMATWLILSKGDVATNTTGLLKVLIAYVAGAYGINKGISHFSPFNSSMPDNEPESQGD